MFIHIEEERKFRALISTGMPHVSSLQLQTRIYKKLRLNKEIQRGQCERYRLYTQVIFTMSNGVSLFVVTRPLKGQLQF